MGRPCIGPGPPQTFGWRFPEITDFRGRRGPESRVATSSQTSAPVAASLVQIRALSAVVGTKGAEHPPQIALPPGGPPACFAPEAQVAESIWVVRPGDSWVGPGPRWSFGFSDGASLKSRIFGAGEGPGAEHQGPPRVPRVGPLWANLVEFRPTLARLDRGRPNSAESGAQMTNFNWCCPHSINFGEILSEFQGRGVG